MKKIILSAIVAVCAISANAQIWAGGSVGFNVGKHADGADNITKFEIAPEVGYNVSDNLAVALELGFTSQNGAFDAEGYPEGQNKYNKSLTSFRVNPYARYTFAESGIAKFFVHGGMSFTTYNQDRGNTIGFGVRPGVAIELSEKVSVVTKLGYVGYKFQSKKAGQGTELGSKGNVFGMGIDNTALSFGIYYNF